MSTPVLDAELGRFGHDLLAAAARPAPRIVVRRPTRRIAIALALIALLAVPAAIAAVRALVLSDDHPVIQSPPGFTVPDVVGTGVEVASGTVPGGTWHAYAVRCGSRASVAVVAPNGSRNSAACGAIPPGGRGTPAAFAPSTLYDGDSQTTFIYAAVPADVARVELDLVGKAQDGPVALPGAGPSHREVVPVANVEATKAVGVDVRFVVLAIAGEQDVQAATATGAGGRVLSRCDDSGDCENTP